MLVELSVMEQRYHAIMEAISGAPVTEVARLAASLEEIVGHPAYGIGQLREDLDRFAFLLGGSDGEALFGPAAR
jgi:hypothetical protein